MKRYGWNKHTDTRRLNSNEMAEDESSEKSQFSLAVKIKRQSYDLLILIDWSWTS